MPEDFVIARNVEDGSSLPYVLRVPYGDSGVLLKARETWPRTTKVYCHRIEEWPEDAEIVDRVPVRSCVRRGASIDLVLERSRENRSQFVMSFAKGGRQAIFWQTARTTKQARPAVAAPTARASGLAELEVVVDSQERYAWKFPASVTTRRARLAAGDYAVERDGETVAAVERKSLGDLVTSLTTGKLRYQMTSLAVLPHAAVVVEERYSRALKHEVVRGSAVAERLAECQVRFPQVPVLFLESRSLAQDWAHRFLAAAYTHVHQDEAGADYFGGLAAAPALTPREPTPVEVRAWALAQGMTIATAGRVPARVLAAYHAAHGRG